MAGVEPSGCLVVKWKKRAGPWSTQHDLRIPRDALGEMCPPSRGASGRGDISSHWTKHLAGPCAPPPLSIGAETPARAANLDTDFAAPFPKLQAPVHWPTAFLEQTCISTSMARHPLLQRTSVGLHHDRALKHGV